MPKWSDRLKVFAQCPWLKPKDGWLDAVQPGAKVSDQQ
jgi:hypothetical protein